jgi:hypothetical protein
MVLRKGEKIHVMVRRSFESDVRRHFAGTVVTDTEGDVVRIEGYAFVWDAGVNRYAKRPELRTRTFSLIDGRNIINVIPSNIDINKLQYTQSKEGHLVVTDGSVFQLDINEFGGRS